MVKRTIEVEAWRWDEPTERKQLLEELRRQGYHVLGYRLGDKYELTLLPSSDHTDD